MKDHKNLAFDSLLIHGGDIEDTYGSAVVPIYQTSTFAFKDVNHGARLFAGEEDGFIYTRIGNPTISALENCVAGLENGFGGIATSSGMGAVNSVYLAFLHSGDHIVSTDAVYGPARVVIENYYSKLGIEYSYVDTSNIQNIIDAIRPNTKMLYIETPANPTIALTDLKKCADIAKKNNLVFVVDNTFCSPYLQKPLDFGADIVLHSVTKFINGHADIVGGIIVAKTQEHYKTVRGAMVTMGFNMDPHQAYLVLRGLKTLSIRMDRAQENAIKVADFLENHPKIEWIKYPGLKSFAQYELAKEQMDGPGAMISFGVKGGLEAGKILMNNVKLALLAVSLGGVETLIQHPASMTHSKMAKEAKLKAGITDELVRYSVGIEDVNDIINDLKQALEKI
ncbi:MAG: methionine gamma-lyase [Bacteroidetes bacterium GWE2_29_8]|nr:MAG: methionine gamma-lyase [Bacteroidetes bacterium GWE2_29_8]OFY14137.1 MAG: methionine gamma-lyase [Bacteroidetes bacterium GWF2_29_10]